MNNILITSAGRRVELVQSFVAVLKKSFPHNKVVTADMHPNLSSACQYAEQSVSLPRVTAEDYISSLLDICIKHAIGMVVPTIDTELLLLAKHREQFAQHGINIIVSDIELVGNCRDKRKTSILFNKIGLNTPIIYPKHSIKYPCFAKPYDGSCSVGAATLMSEEELTESMQNDDKMIFMELVDSQYTEYTVDAYFDQKGTLKCIVPRQRIEVRAGEVSKGVTRKGPLYDYLLPKLKLIKGARGCLTIQIFVNENHDRFFALEINPRFGGGFPLSISAGANYSAWLIAEYFEGLDIDFYGGWEEDLLMLRYDSKVIVHSYL